MGMDTTCLHHMYLTMGAVHRWRMVIFHLRPTEGHPFSRVSGNSVFVPSSLIFLEALSGFVGGKGLKADFAAVPPDSVDTGACVTC